MSHTRFDEFRNFAPYVAALLLASAAGVVTAAEPQTSVRVRGTITAFDGNVLSVKSRDGKDLKLRLADNAVVVAAKAIKLEDLKPGDYVGSTTRTKDGVPVALEVHTLAPTTKPGHIPWDLEPDTMMTNGNVAAVVQSAGGQQLTLEYTGSSQKILVPAGTPIVTNTPADRSFLKPGEYIWTAAQIGTDGTMTVQRVQVSKDGVKPPH